MVIVNTLFQQHKRRLNTWTSPDGQHRNQIDYILCSQRWRSSIQEKQEKQDSELTVAQTMSSLLLNSDLLKTVGKTTRPFRYDLNQIPHDYTVEVRNRFKGLDLIDSVAEHKLQAHRFRLSCLMARGIFPDQRSNPHPLHWQEDS